MSDLISRQAANDAKEKRMMEENTKMIEENNAVTYDCRPDYEAEYKRLRAENEELKKRIDWLKNWHDENRYEQARLIGMIDGLKFAIRCNGVSGRYIE